MPKNKYTEKQMKMGGGMVKYAEGGDVRKEMLMQMLEDARENNDDDKIIEIEAELFQMGDGQGMMGGGMVKRPGYKHGGKVHGYRDGMSVNTNKGRG